MQEIKISDKAAAIHRHFMSLAGPEHIATIANIQTIVSLCEHEKPERILELGGGIGALSYAMLKHSDAYVDIYEDDDFCKDELQKNLKEFDGRFSIIPNYRILPPHRAYDFIIIDGGNKLPYRPEWFYLRYLQHIKAVFIEGHRRAQVAAATRALWAHSTMRMEKTPGVTLEGKFYKGGTLIRCTPSRSALLRTASYIYSRLREDMLFDRLHKYIKRAITGKRM